VIVLGGELGMSEGGGRCGASRVLLVRRVLWPLMDA
jgi:hypothetical protein